MYLRAVANTFRSKRFWIWQLGSVFIYSIPATIRITTGNIHLPLLSMFMVPWVTPYVPGNIVEKVLVNAFFPGGAGAVAGEILYSKVHSESFTRRQKYLARLGGAWLWTAGWSLFQFWGYMQNVTGSYGGNLLIPTCFPTQLPAGNSLYSHTRRSGVPQERSGNRLPWVVAQKKLILPILLK